MTCIERQRNDIDGGCEYEVTVTAMPNHKKLGSFLGNRNGSPQSVKKLPESEVLGCSLE